MICSYCDDLLAMNKRLSSEEYFFFVNRFKDDIEKGGMILVEGEYDLNALIVNGSWVDDSIVHKFKCTKCDRMHRLYADTYHGYGNCRVIHDTVD